VTEPRLPDPAVERRQAVALFNHVWSLLDLEVRTAEQDDAMLHAAHASRWHWGNVGGPAEWAVGEWQCSRVYAVLGRAEPAVHHARRCVALCEQHGLGGFVPASAHEAMARALAVAGDVAGSQRHRREATRLCALIDDPDDRAVVEADLSTVPSLDV
jgi:hypothetical protein